MTAIAKYMNISGKKYINAPAANIPATGFMKDIILFICINIGDFYKLLCK